MGTLIYSMNISLDGFAATSDGSLDWANVDEELHQWFNDLSRDAAAFVYGRRLHTTMADYWPFSEEDPDATPITLEFGRIWRDTPKFVVSSTLTDVGPNARLISGDPIAEIARLRSELDGPIDVGGPTLAHALMAAGLIDEWRPVVHPVVLGGGLAFWPEPGSPLELVLHETRTFRSGAVMLSYRPR